MTSLQSKLRTLQNTTANAAVIDRLAPAMLGADGARKYLVVFHNLAEPRAIGGIVGSFAVLDVVNGKITIVDQGSGSRDLGTFEPAIPTLAELPKNLYGILPGRYPADVNLALNFPLAAQLISTMYTSRRHVHLDGVLALDPVALSYLLVGAKPIPVGGGVILTSATITKILFSEAYARYSRPAEAPARDLFLAAATTRAFHAVMSAPTDAASLLPGLKRGVAEHRILLWSARGAEQQDLTRSELAGASACRRRNRTDRGGLSQ